MSVILTGLGDESQSSKLFKQIRFAPKQGEYVSVHEAQ